MPVPHFGTFILRPLEFKKIGIWEEMYRVVSIDRDTHTAVADYYKTCRYNPNVIRMDPRRLP